MVIGRYFLGDNSTVQIEKSNGEIVGYGFASQEEVSDGNKRSKTIMIQVQHWVLFPGYPKSLAADPVFLRVPSTGDWTCIETSTAFLARVKSTMENLRDCRYAKVNCLSHSNNFQEDLTQPPRPKPAPIGLYQSDIGTLVGIGDEPFGWVWTESHNSAGTQTTEHWVLLDSYLPPSRELPVRLGAMRIRSKDEFFDIMSGAVLEGTSYSYMIGACNYYNNVPDDAARKVTVKPKTLRSSSRSAGRPRGRKATRSPS